MEDCRFVPVALQKCVSLALETDRCRNFLQCRGRGGGEKSSPFPIHKKNAVCRFGAVTHKISINSSHHPWEILSSVSKEFIAV